MSKYYSTKELLFSAKGQLSPKGFFGGFIFSFLIFLSFSFLFVFSTLFGKPPSLVFYPLAGIFVISLLLFMVSIINFVIKRYHSLGVSGWSLLLAPFSIIGLFIIYPILTYSIGENKKNEYGKIDKKEFKIRWFEKTINWLIETLNGRMLLTIIGFLIYIIDLAIFEKQFFYENLFYFISALVGISFIFRFKLIEKNVKKIITLMNYIGAVVLVGLVFGGIILLPILLK